MSGVKGGADEVWPEIQVGVTPLSENFLKK
jgi:hypothetical protein